MKDNFNTLPLPGLKAADIRAYREQSGLPPENGRLMYFYLTGLLAERASVMALRPRKAANQPHGNNDAPARAPASVPTTSQIRSAALNAASNGTADNTFNIGAWRAEKQQQEKTAAAARAQIKASRPSCCDASVPVFSSQRADEERAATIALHAMHSPTQSARFLLAAGAMFFGDDETAETAACYALAQSVIRRDLEDETPGRRNRALHYDTQMARFAADSMRIAKDPEYINSPRCAPESRTLFILQTYDVLANQLADRTAIADMPPGLRAHTAKFCVNVERLQSRHESGLWGLVQSEARRVRQMILDDMSTSRELKREMGVPHP